MQDLKKLWKTPLCFMGLTWNFRQTEKSAFVWPKAHLCCY